MLWGPHWSQLVRVAEEAPVVLGLDLALPVEADEGD